MFALCRICLFIITFTGFFPTSEPPGFWTALANSSTVAKKYRNYCVSQLFRRHVGAGMTLSALARVLNEPTWLRHAQVSAFEDELMSDPNANIITLLRNGPRIPVHSRHGDTVLVLRVFCDTENRSVIYLHFSGRLDPQTFTQAIKGKPDPVTADSILLEVGFAPDIFGFRVISDP